MRPIVLASSSAARQALLQKSGVPFIAKKAPFDERGWAPNPPLTGAALALALAEKKGKSLFALLESQKDPLLEGDPLLIGCDQVLVCEGEVLHKAANRQQVQQKLWKLRGKPHSLHSAVVLINAEGEVCWRYAEKATLWMRAFSKSFLEWYLDQEGEKIFSSVGGYHIEGLGLRLFEKIDGCLFNIMGLPLLPLLQQLTQRERLPPV